MKTGWVHGGIVTATSGTPVQLSTDSMLVRAILIQALRKNTKPVAIGSSNTVRSGDGSSTNQSGTVLAVLGKPTTADDTPPSIDIGLTQTPGGPGVYFDPSEIWIDPDANDEGVAWSYMGKKNL